MLPYRNRLDHDVWNTFIPREGDTEFNIQGQGEAHLTSTTLSSIDLIEKTFGYVSYKCERLMSHLDASFGKSDVSTGTTEALIIRICSAVNALSAATNDDWKWHQLERVDP